MKRLFVVLVLSFSFLSASCWSAGDDASLGFNDLEGEIDTSAKLVFSLKSAVDCSPIVGAKVEFMNQSSISGANGDVVFDKVGDDINETKILKVTKDGFITYQSNVDVAFGIVWQKKHLLSPKLLDGQVRFVLSWDARPKDLDLMLVGDNFKISYRNKVGKHNQAFLDKDSQDGYGPETITLRDIDKNKQYKLYLSNYSKDADFDNHVIVRVYTDDSTLLPHEISPTSAKCIEVAVVKDARLSFYQKAVDESECK